MSGFLALQTASIQHWRGDEGTLLPHIHMWISPGWDGSKKSELAEPEELSQERKGL